jgi:hypothetical protein
MYYAIVSLVRDLWARRKSSFWFDDRLIFPSNFGKTVLQRLGVEYFCELNKYGHSATKFIVSLIVERAASPLLFLSFRRTEQGGLKSFASFRLEKW